MRIPLLIYLILVVIAPSSARAFDDAASESRGTEFFERQIRPLLVKHCYQCHSEDSRAREGGLLLDREQGWLQGGDTGKAVVPGDVDASLLIQAVTRGRDDLQMPPEEALAEREVRLLKQWVAAGAPGPQTDAGTTEFSQLGDQEYLFSQAADHWAFQPVSSPEPPNVENADWNESPIDRFVFRDLSGAGLPPSPAADNHVLLRRLSFDLTGLPPTYEEMRHFDATAEDDRFEAVVETVNRMMASPQYGVHLGLMWLDVARYADTDSAYRPDTRTPYYFPFAFTYRDYVVDSFNADKPYDQFLKEQLAADLMGFAPSAPQTAALGFLATGPYANRNPAESIDDWIDVTTRGLMGITVACARCHDHKYEPVPTTDYYALHGVFASVRRLNELDEKNLPQLPHYESNPRAAAIYRKKRDEIDQKILAAGDSKSRGNNNRAVSQKIRETVLAELLLFEPGAPVHTMTIKENSAAADSFVAIRGDAKNRGERVPRRFLKLLDPTQTPFTAGNSGRLALAKKIADPDNPLTARVFVNRIWTLLMGAGLVATPSDFGLQGARPSHPELLDWLTSDFVSNGWSTKHLVRTIVTSRTYQQQSTDNARSRAIDSENQLLWRAHRKRLEIEAIRDSMLMVSQQLDPMTGGRPAQLWGRDYTKRRAIYGFVNRFNLDPALRAFDFPARMQTIGVRGESIVAPQALLAMNSRFAIEQSIAATELSEFRAAGSDDERIQSLFEAILQRRASMPECHRIGRFVEGQDRYFESPRMNSDITNSWPLEAQSLMMSNEFLYVD